MAQLERHQLLIQTPQNTWSPTLRTGSQRKTPITPSKISPQSTPETHSNKKGGSDGTPSRKLKNKSKSRNIEIRMVDPHSSTLPKNRPNPTNHGDTLPRTKAKPTNTGAHSPRNREKLTNSQEEMEARHEQEIQALNDLIKDLHTELNLTRDKLANLIKNNNDDKSKQILPKENNSVQNPKITTSHSPNIQNDAFKQTVKELDRNASTKFKSKNYIDALELYLKLIGLEETGRKEPGLLAFYWNNAAICWYQLGGVDQALKAIGKAIDFKPSSAVQFYNRAGFYNKIGNQSKAVADLKKTLELDPSHKEAKTRLTEMEKRQSTNLFFV